MLLRAKHTVQKLSVLKKGTERKLTHGAVNTTPNLDEPWEINLQKSEDRRAAK